LRSNTKCYSGKTHHIDSQNSDTTAPSDRELYHLQFSHQADSPETFDYTLLCTHTHTHIYMYVHINISIYVYKPGKGLHNYDLFSVFVILHLGCWVIFTLTLPVLRTNYLAYKH